MAYWKKIKNTNAVPVLKDELVFDQTPTVNSTNPVTSDGVARAIAGASGEVPVVTENDNGKVLKAIYDAGGPAVEWGEATVDQTYTAGDGIDITANAVSVKAGNGLSIGDATSSETVSLTTSEYYRESYSTGYVAYDICPLTDSLLESINSGLTLKLNYGAYLGYLPNVTAYACLYSYASTTQYEVTLDKRLVLGSSVLNQGSLPPNSEVTFNGSSVNAELSNTTMSDLIADMSSNTYHIGILVKTNDGYFALNFQVSHSSLPSGPTTMATYTETTTFQNTLNVSNPLPASAVGDAGRVLTVDATGAASWAAPSVTVDQTYNASSTNAQSGTAVAGALSTTRQVPPCYTSDANKVLTVNSLGIAGWATPSGGSSFTLTKVGTVTDYLPTTGGKELSFTSVSGQSNFIDPTKLYMLKVNVSTGSGGLSFGSAPYFALMSFNTEYNAVNRTHLSYAFPQIYSGDMSSTASTNTPVYFFDEVANNLHIAPTGGQENDLKIVVSGVNSSSANSHQITVDLYMVN